MRNRQGQRLLLRRNGPSMAMLVLSTGLVCAPAMAEAKAVQSKPVPASQGTSASSFQSFVQALWPLAQARGISRATFDLAFQGVTLDASIIALTRKQAEFVAPVWSYINSAVGGGKIARGQNMAAEYAGVLAQAERTYGVPKEILLGIWGMETGFGGFKGDKDVIRSLATLATIRYRGDFFRDELLVALEMLQKGHVQRGQLRGSWAGAMGHTQFMPSSYMKYAVDQTGDGHADIWSSPADALASTANYMKSFGWVTGLPWALEVRVPQGYDYRLFSGSFGQFTSAGLQRADGRALPSSGEARLFFPAGHTGPAFLLSANFDVIKKYNSSDAYALGVGHLGDRIMGRAAIQGDWPVSAPRLTKAQTQQVQRALRASGLYQGDADGRIGSQTRDAVRQYQMRVGLVPDGYPTPALLARMK